MSIDSFGWNTSKSPKRGLGTDLTEEVAYLNISIYVKEEIQT